MSRPIQPGAVSATVFPNAGALAVAAEPRGGVTMATTPSIVWQSLSTGERSIWLMNSNTWTGTHTELPVVPTQWSIAASADFNADGKPDFLWQNTSTGERSIWVMNGVTYAGNHSDLPTVSTTWSVAAVLAPSKHGVSIAGVPVSVRPCRRWPASTPRSPS